MKRLFIGNIVSGTEELNKHNTLTVTNKPKWFGDLKEGDWTFISEKGSKVDKLLEVSNIEKKDDTVIYHFDVIKKYDSYKKANEILSSKYFELNLVVFNKALNQSWYEQFFELTIKDKYKKVDFSKVSFDENDYRAIYVTQDKNKIKDKKDGDVFIIVSSEEDGFNIKKVEEYDIDKKSYKKIVLKNIAENITIEKYGFKKAYEIAKNNENGKKKKSKSTILERIINGIKEGYYEHPIDSNLSRFYNILVVQEKDEEIIEKSEDKTKTIEKEKYCFISKEQLQEIEELLEYNKNIILEGVPGVGKTYIARKIASKISHGKEENIQVIQFHQTYAYEDFIQGLRPKNNVFETVDGILKAICDKAKEDIRNGNDSKYVLIIDEINRGNISKIFGETFMLIEKDKRRTKEQILNNELSKYAVRLPYSQNKEEKFDIPENVYIIGTMNTMDKSIALMDYALKRRFGIYEIKPCFEDEEGYKGFKKYLEDINNDNLNTLVEKIISINENKKLEGIKFGHSYFCGLDSETEINIDKKVEFIIKYEIIPQLKEYLLGDNKKLKKMKDFLDIKNKSYLLKEENNEEDNDE